MKEGAMKAVCINDENNGGFKMTTLTKGKEYHVKNSRDYCDYYEVINNLGLEETYKKERFKITENKKVVRCIDKNIGQEITVGKEYIVRSESEKLYFIENDLEEVVGYYKEKFKIVECEKMEDKTIRVRCIINGNMQQLALKIGKEYDATESRTISGAYTILLDDLGRKNMNFSKEWFEEVKEDVLMVECIDDSNGDLLITPNKQYKILEESSLSYYIMNDANEIADYLKSHFKPVLKEKEVKEYTLEEVIANIKEGETYIQNTIDKFSITKEHKGILIKRLFEGSKNEMWINTEIKFTKAEEPKPVSTVEAFKALNEGKIIESTITKDQYSKENETINIKMYIEQEKGFCKCKNILAKELEGMWIVHE